ncbi:MAG: hypothetical protein RLP12_11400, partial [Ekhidna sp.]
HHQIYQIYHGMIALTLVPFALLFLEWDSSLEKVEVDYSSVLFILAAQLFWVIGFACWYVWKGERVLYVFEEEMSLHEKLKEFKRKNIYKYLILAAAGFIAAFAMWVQPSFLFVIAYFAVLVQYSFLRPSEDKLVRDMRLSKEERNELHSK